MKKLIVCLTLTLGLLPTWAQKKVVKKVAIPTIKGVVSPEVKTVYMLDIQNNNTMIDSAKVVNGAFSFKYNPNNKNNFYGIGYNSTFVIVINEPNIKINLTNKRLENGSPLNKKLNAYTNAVDSINDKGDVIYAEYQRILRDTTLTDDAKTEQINKCREQFADLQKETFQYVRTVIANNKDNIIPAFFIHYLLGGVDNEELKELLNPQYAYSNHPATANIKADIEKQEKKKMLIGKDFIDLTLNDTNGLSHKLSDYVGKGNYVLIDFWASWCGPCRAEMPNVVENYNKYHDKGFEIIGISFDNNAEAWKAAIAQMKMNWINLSDLKAWNSDAGKVYGVDAIPASVLVDPQGKVIARDLRGEELGAKLEEIYGF